MGVKRWRELVTDRKNGGALFDRPKPTVGCSDNGRRIIIIYFQLKLDTYIRYFTLGLINL
jgi:hypothetical protein